MGTTADPTRIDIEFDPTHQRMMGVAVHGNTPFDVPFISEIVPGFWQGGCEDGLILPGHIRNVLSLYRWEAYTLHDGVDNFEAVTMYDSARLPNLDEVVRLAKKVNEWRAQGPTLVHCQAGLNRSGLVAAAALVIGDGMSPADAIALLREKRSPAVLCNRHFEAFILAGRFR